MSWTKTSKINEDIENISDEVYTIIMKDEDEHSSDIYSAIKGMIIEDLKRNKKLKDIQYYVDMYNSLI